jgi:hypothetical protein
MLTSTDYPNKDDWQAVLAECQKKYTKKINRPTILEERWSTVEDQTLQPIKHVDTAIKFFQFKLL